jgi:hypothetical protein
LVGRHDLDLGVIKKPTGFCGTLHHFLVVVFHIIVGKVWPNFRLYFKKRISKKGLKKWYHCGKILLRQTDRTFRHDQDLISTGDHQREGKIMMQLAGKHVPDDDDVKVPRGRRVRPTLKEYFCPTTYIICRKLLLCNVSNALFTNYQFKENMNASLDFSSSVPDLRDSELLFSEQTCSMDICILKTTIKSTDSY